MMNKRIRELFKQAGGKTSTRNLASNPVQVVETHELWDDRIEKFAELIVKECAHAIVNDGRLNDVRSAANGCVRTIREHFGVES